MSRRSRGFTLVELLVVIAIIGMLIALLLPAVQAAREAGRRTTCKNNIRQMALALQLYENTYTYLPPGDYTIKTGTFAGKSAGISLHAHLLPFIEAENIRDVINFNAPYNDSSNVVPYNMKIQTFLCPSDGREQVPVAQGAPNNYYGNSGVQILFSGVPSATGPNSTMPPSDGLFFKDSKMTWASVKDGLSKTASFSEKLCGDGSNGISSPRSDTFQPGTYPNTPDEALQQCMAADVNSLGMQGYSNVGAPWLQSYHSTTRYWHVLPPNSRSCMYPPGRISTTPSSNHPGGVNMALCDASVVFVVDKIDLPVWRAFGTRAGKEVVNDYP
jgi:prepilin-type N-terminal cleavage/methylation domain-containing protein